jgi:lysophospholipase L1-like esterase
MTGFAELEHKNGAARVGLGLLMGLSLLGAEWGTAQEAVKAPAKAEVKGEAKKEGVAVPAVDVADAEKERIAFDRKVDFDLTPEQVARFKKWLPNAYRNLSMRKPFHIVALGDSVVEMFGYDEDAENWIKGYPAQFAEQLARQFFYTGGVRLIKPAKGKPDKSQPHRGMEITLRNLGKGGKMSIHAMQTLSTYGLEVKPDLVLVSYGINDSSVGMDLGVYARAFQEVVTTVRAAGGEVILLGPTLVVSDPPEVDLGRTRALADTLRDVAEESGAFFVDLGDLAGLVKVPEELEEPGDVFASVVESYRRFYDHQSVVDYVHPRTALHMELGRRIYRELIDGPMAMPWAVGPAQAVVEDGKHFALSVELENRSELAQRIIALPLVAPAWKPMDVTPAVELAPGGKQVLKIRYARREDFGGAQANPMPSHEPLLRLPLLVNAGETVRIEDVRAELRPAVLLWKVETQFNQQGEFAPANLLKNTSGKVLEGKWQASWMGQTVSGDFKVAAGESSELPLRFKLPTKAGSPFNQDTELSVLVTIGEQTLRFDRRVDLTWNFGLKEVVPMTVSTAKVSPKVPQLGDRERSVTLKADADKENLFLTFDIRGIDLKEDPAGGPSWTATVNLDARSYGKRLMRGVTDPLRLSGKASDGQATVAAIAPWAFGVGYAANFDEAYVKAVLSSGSEGARRVTLTIPRSYLYLHEWALGNGNSEIGINATINFWQPAANGGVGGTFPPDHFFSLIYNRHRDDAEGNAVLELTAEPTQRWTITLY